MIKVRHLIEILKGMDPDSLLVLESEDYDHNGVYFAPLSGVYNALYIPPGRRGLREWNDGMRAYGCSKSDVIKKPKDIEVAVKAVFLR